MIITGIQTRIVELFQPKPLITGNIKIESIWFLLVDIYTNQGITGSSYIWSFNKAGAAAQKAVIEHLSKVVLNEDTKATPRIWEKMWKALIQWGHSGIPIMGLSAIDSACWDAVGKELNQPLVNILGRKLEAVPAYASGLWITNDFDALQKEASEHLALGFNAIKMRVGRSTINQDIEAVRLVRQAVGDQTALMVDFSSAPLRAHAHQLARALEPFSLTWIEDPIADENMKDHAEFTASVNTPVCFGEKVYTHQGFLEIIENRAADILMADLQRAGGVTGWNRIAGMADAARYPLSSHILPELNLHLIGSAPTGYYLEHLTWAENLFNEQMELHEGKIKIPNGPGFGISWNEKTILNNLKDLQTFN